MDAAMLLRLVFCQHFYIPLGADSRAIVPNALLGRAASLLALVAVSAIPILQLGFGAVLDAAVAAGLGHEARYRTALGCLGALIACCAGIYFGPPWRDNASPEPKI